MELSELRQRLEGFCAAHYSGPTEITEVVDTTDHEQGENPYYT